MRSDETTLPSLPPLTATLLAAERGAPPPPADARRTVWRRTRRTLLASGLAVPSLLAAKLSAAALGTKIVAVVFLGALAAAAGVGVGALIRADHVTPVDPRPAALPQPPVARVPAPRPASSVPAPPPQFRARVLDLAHERQLIDRARAASVAAPLAAARLLERHRREFPAGLFAEEREAMLIITWARAGRTDRARRLALRFTADFPQSIHADRITVALAAADR